MRERRRQSTRELLLVDALDLDGALAGRQRDTRHFKTRYLWVVLVVAAVFVGYGLRLWQLQVVDTERYTRLSARNFVQTVDLPHPRGMILDRRGRILVDNRPGYDLYITPAFVADRAATLDRLADLFGLHPDVTEEMERRLRAARGLAAFKPVRVLEDLSRDHLAAFETHKLELDGVKVESQPRRRYRGGGLAAHLLGYMNEVSRPELERLTPRGYRRGDTIGRRGVEQAMEPHLRGRDGWTKVVVDAKGRPVEAPEAADLLATLSDARREAVPGYNVVLAIDADLQDIMEAAFGGAQGAAVALDPRTGFVRAMMSKPAFDPNEVSGRISPEAKKRLDDDPLEPWINKATQNHYAPGSTFKVVAALAGLAEGVITPETTVRCPGYYQFGPRAWRCHRDKGHGAVRLVDALAVSCDVFFYETGMRLGQDRIAGYGRALGFGELSGIGVGAEVRGIMPDREWYARHVPGGFNKGLTLNTVIGQGDVVVTPLQLAIAYAALANGGRVWRPQVVERVEAPDGDVVQRYEPALRDTLEVPPRALQKVVEGLTEVVNSPRGTAYARRSPDLAEVRIAGKTGTAQVVTLGEKREKAEDMDFFERDHAWFVAFAPVADPRIVVVVLNAHGGHGGSGAAPIAMDVLRAWFHEVEPRYGVLTPGEGTGDVDAGVVMD